MLSTSARVATRHQNLISALAIGDNYRHISAVHSTASGAARKPLGKRARRQTMMNWWHRVFHRGASEAHEAHELNRRTNDAASNSRRAQRLVADVSLLERDVAERIVRHWNEQFGVTLVTPQSEERRRVRCVALASDDVGAVAVAELVSKRLFCDSDSSATSSNSDSNSFREASRSSASSSIHEAPPRALAAVALDGDAAQKALQAFLKRLDIRSEPLVAASDETVVVPTPSSAAVPPLVHVVSIDESAAMCAAAFQRRLLAAQASGIVPQRHETRLIVPPIRLIVPPIRLIVPPIRPPTPNLREADRRAGAAVAGVDIIVLDEAARAASARFASRLHG
jgi:hypothetical protein